MNRILSIILIFSMVFLFLSACGENDVIVIDNEESNQEDERGLSNIKKIDGKVTNATPFSEGLAFVSIENNRDEEKQNLNICIDQKGNVVYTIEDGYAISQYKDGYALIFKNVEDDYGNFAECIVDKKGNTIFSLGKLGYESLFVTDDNVELFYNGYIPVISYGGEDEKGYSIVNGVGVLDNKGKWKFKVSDKYFKDFSDDLDFAYSYVGDGWLGLYFHSSEQQIYWNMKNGNIKTNSLLNLDLSLVTSNDGVYYTDDYYNKVIDISYLADSIDIEKSTNIDFESSYGEIVTVKNSKVYYSLISRSGNFLIKDVEVKTKNYDKDSKVCNAALNKNSYWIFEIDGNIKVYDFNKNLKFSLTPVIDADIVDCINVTESVDGTSYMIEEIYYEKDKENNKKTIYYIVDNKGQRMIG